MITIETEKQIRKVNTDVKVRVRHHALAVQRVADQLKLCILGNSSLTIEAMGGTNGRRFGYCYKITTPTNNRYYITYDHVNEEIFIKDKMRNYKVLHTFSNNASDMDIVTAVRNTLK